MSTREPAASVEQQSTREPLLPGAEEDGLTGRAAVRQVVRPMLRRAAPS
ncbi:MAG: hypothetical protein ACRDQ1_05375 [Sciscionella sp.]